MLAGGGDGGSCSPKAYEHGTYIHTWEILLRGGRGGEGRVQIDLGWAARVVGMATWRHGGQGLPSFVASLFSERLLKRVTLAACRDWLGRVSTREGGGASRRRRQCPVWKRDSPAILPFRDALCRRRVAAGTEREGEPHPRFHADGIVFVGCAVRRPRVPAGREKIQTTINKKLQENENCDHLPRSGAFLARLPFLPCSPPVLTATLARAGQGMTMTLSQMGWTSPLTASLARHSLVCDQLGSTEASLVLLLLLLLPRRAQALLKGGEASFGFRLADRGDMEGERRQARASSTCSASHGIPWFFSWVAFFNYFGATSRRHVGGCVSCVLRVPCRTECCSGADEESKTPALDNSVLDIGRPVTLVVNNNAQLATMFLL